MRVFEAMCIGSLLVTDRAEGSDLEWFFEDGKHLSLYDDDRLEETI
jgi:spore maturation protein CgeB